MSATTGQAPPARGPGRQDRPDRPGRPRRPPLTLVLCVGLLATLLLAGVAGRVASSSPDGLNRVAEDHGMTADGDRGPDGLLSGYRIPGVEGWLASALAGLAGVAVVLLLAGMLVLWLRRGASAGEADPARSPAPAPAPSPSPAPAPAPAPSPEES